MPVFFERASGAELVDVDGNVYADLCLGDTGAMTGHAPAPTVAAVNERLARGITAMLPTEDAALVLLFSLVASGQIKLRKIDGWQKIGAVLNQHTAVAA